MKEISVVWGEGLNICQTTDAELFYFDDENKKAKQIFPILENEYYEIYMLPGNGFIMYVVVGKWRGERKFLLEFSQESTEIISYKLMGASFAFTSPHETRHGVVEGWNVVSRCGKKYEKIFLNDTLIISELDYDCSGVLRVHFVCPPFDHGVSFYIQEWGKWREITKKQAMTLSHDALRFPAKVVRGWRSYEELGFAETSIAE